jgi:phosphotriesterase-related protein
VSRNDVVGKVMTVLGPVEPDALGAVLMHEHLYFDFEATAEEGPTQPERVDILRAYAAPYIRNLHDYGCHTLVDCTTMPHRAEPGVYTMLAEMTGCHIVLATGSYREAAPTDAWRRPGAGRPHRWLDQRVVDSSVEELARIMVGEFRDGVRGSGVRAGIIKLASTLPNFSPGEEKTFRAGAQAQTQTGLCITTHAVGMGVPQAQVDLLEQTGADLERVIIGHTSRHIVETPWAARRLMDRGVSLLPTNLRMDREFDFNQRLVNGIRRLFDAGYGDRLVLGLDWAFDNAEGVFLPCNFMPPPPYMYMFTHTLPRMRELGLEEEAIERMLVTNPRRLLPVEAHTAEQG